MSLDKIKIEKTAQNLIRHFDNEAKLKVEEKDSGLYLNIETESSGLLIGHHGETLEALQYVLRLMIAKALVEYPLLTVDIGGYRILKEKEIQEYAKEIAQKVIDTGEISELRPMNAYERRLVHLVLKEMEGITSESVGFEPERRIVIKPMK